MVCVDPSGRKLRGIAYDLKGAGYRIGIATSVSIDHATPAAFYAVDESRDNYYHIARQLAPSGFDFFAGSGFLNPGGEGRGGESVYAQIEKAGYAVVRTPEELARVPVSPASASPAPQKVVIAQDKGRPQDALAMAIDRIGEGNDGWALADFTRAGIRILDNPKGFFFMVEGGQIDWAAHANDAAAVIFEVIDFSKAVGIAVDFYKARPSETLIVVTADHETGGLTLGSGNAPYELKPGIIKSRVRMGKRVDVDIRKQNAQAGIGWTTGGHTGVPVPIFAIGAGSEAFGGEMDNTEIPKKIMGIVGER
jgi:alkaline phosphatase